MPSESSEESVQETGKETVEDIRKRLANVEMALEKQRTSIPSENKEEMVARIRIVGELEKTRERYIREIADLKSKQ